MIFLAGFLLVGLTLLVFIASQVTRKMHWIARVLLLPWAIIGVVLDIVLLNAVIATIVFLELPREWTFSGRINRLEHYGFGYRERLASWVCEHFLRPIDPRHC